MNNIQEIINEYFKERQLYDKKFISVNSLISKLKLDFKKLMKKKSIFCHFNYLMHSNIETCKLYENDILFPLKPLKLIPHVKALKMFQKPNQCERYCRLIQYLQHNSDLFAKIIYHSFNANHINFNADDYQYFIFHTFPALFNYFTDKNESIYAINVLMHIFYFHNLYYQDNFGANHFFIVDFIISFFLSSNCIIYFSNILSKALPPFLNFSKSSFEAYDDNNAFFYQKTCDTRLLRVSYWKKCLLCAEKILDLMLESNPLLPLSIKLFFKCFLATFPNNKNKHFIIIFDCFLCKSLSALENNEYLQDVCNIIRCAFPPSIRNNSLYEALSGIIDFNNLTNKCENYIEYFRSKKNQSKVDSPNRRIPIPRVNSIYNMKSQNEIQSNQEKLKCDNTYLTKGINNAPYYNTNFVDNNSSSQLVRNKMMRTSGSVSSFSLLKKSHNKKSSSSKSKSNMDLSDSETISLQSTHLNSANNSCTRFNIRKPLKIQYGSEDSDYNEFEFDQGFENEYDHVVTSRDLNFLYNIVNFSLIQIQHLNNKPKDFLLIFGGISNMKIVDDKNMFEMTRMNFKSKKDLKYFDDDFSSIYLMLFNLTNSGSFFKSSSFYSNSQNIINIIELANTKLNEVQKNLILNIDKEIPHVISKIKDENKNLSTTFNILSNKEVLTKQISEDFSSILERISKRYINKVIIHFIIRESKDFIFVSNKINFIDSKGFSKLKILPYDYFINIFFDFSNSLIDHIKKWKISDINQTRVLHSILDLIINLTFNVSHLDSKVSLFDHSEPSLFENKMNEYIKQQISLINNTKLNDFSSLFGKISLANSPPMICIRDILQVILDFKYRIYLQISNTKQSSYYISALSLIISMSANIHLYILNEFLETYLKDENLQQLIFSKKEKEAVHDFLEAISLINSIDIVIPF